LIHFDILMLQAHGRRGSISVASRLSVLPSPEKTANIQAPLESKLTSSFAIFDDSKKSPISSSQPAPFAVFCDDEPNFPAPVPSSRFAVFEDTKPELHAQEEAVLTGPCSGIQASVTEHKSSFAVFCDDPGFKYTTNSSAPAPGFSGTTASGTPLAQPAALSFAVFCDEDEHASSNTGNHPYADSTPHKDLNTSLASLHWSPLSCIAEESTMIDGRTSLLDGSMCKGIRSVGRSCRKRRLSGTDFAYEDTEVLPSLVKCAEPYTDIERSRLNRLAMGMLQKHPGLFGQVDATFNQPFAFKAAKGKAKEKLKAFDCQWEVLESLGKGGFGTASFLKVAAVCQTNFACIRFTRPVAKMPALGHGLLRAPPKSMRSNASATSVLGNSTSGQLHSLR
jgi:hypothetical protein